MGWFLYDRDFLHERVNVKWLANEALHLAYFQVVPSAI